MESVLVDPPPTEVIRTPEIGVPLVEVIFPEIKYVGIGLTLTLDAPDIEDVTVSVAVMTWFPAVLKVAENVPLPPVKVEFAGRLATESVLLNCTVPE